MVAITADSSSAKFLFRALCTGGGSCPVLAKPPIDGGFLRFCVGKVGEVPRKVSVCMDGQAFSTAYRVGKRGVLTLRNVRYVDPSVTTWALFSCGGCGWSFHCLSGSVPAEGLRVCPQCKAKPSVMKCSAWHTFGACDFCTGEVLEACPFEPSIETGAEL